MTTDANPHTNGKTFKIIRTERNGIVGNYAQMPNGAVLPICIAGMIAFKVSVH